MLSRNRIQFESSSFIYWISTTTKSLQQGHCATIRTFWTCTDSPFYAFIVNSPLTTLSSYEPFQKEMGNKDGASTNWLRESLRKGTFGINKSFSWDRDTLWKVSVHLHQRSTLSETKGHKLSRGGTGKLLCDR